MTNIKGVEQKTELEEYVGEYNKAVEYLETLAVHIDKKWNEKSYAVADCESALKRLRREEDELKEQSGKMHKALNVLKESIAKDSGAYLDHGDLGDLDLQTKYDSVRDAQL